LVRRSSLLEIGGFDEGLSRSQDYDLWLRLAQAGNHFVALREPLVVKHENAGPQVSTNARAKMEGAEVPWLAQGCVSSVS
jgi:GT2 family glycosyltransferase